MSYYERNLPHIQRDFRPHFITFATHKRSLMPPWARDIVFNSCQFHNDRTCDLLAAVVLPDHVHLILIPLIDRAKSCVVPLEWITRSIKGYSARQMNAQTGRRGQVWQDESFDHVIRTGDFDNKLEYLLQNPVRNGMVKKWEDYRWCYWKRTG